MRQERFTLLEGEEKRGQRPSEDAGRGASEKRGTAGSAGGSGGKRRMGEVEGVHSSRQGLSPSSSPSLPTTKPSGSKPADRRAAPSATPRGAGKSEGRAGKAGRGGGGRGWGLGGKRVSKKAESDSSEDDACWTCEEEGGVMILCDGEGCKAQHHLGCVGLKAVPNEDWLCPSCKAGLEKGRAKGKRKMRKLLDDSEMGAEARDAMAAERARQAALEQQPAAGERPSVLCQFCPSRCVQTSTASIHFFSPPSPPIRFPLLPSALLSSPRFPSARCCTPLLPLPCIAPLLNLTYLLASHAPPPTLMHTHTLRSPSTHFPVSLLMAACLRAQPSRRPPSQMFT